MPGATKSARLGFMAFIGVWILFFTIFCGTSMAGNKKMMEQLGQDLVKLNSEVIEKLQSAQADARISLDARVVQGEAGGPHLIVIDAAKIIPAGHDGSAINLRPGKGKDSSERSQVLDNHPTPYASHLSYQDLDIPNTADSGSETAGQTDLKILMDRHPEARVIELSGNAIDKVHWEPHKTPARAFLIFW